MWLDERGVRAVTEIGRLEGPAALPPFREAPRHHVWGVLLGPVTTNRSISMGSVTIAIAAPSPSMASAIYPHWSFFICGGPKVRFWT